MRSRRWRRKPQKRAEQERAAKAADKDKFVVSMKTKQKWKFVSLAVLKRRPEAQVQYLFELKRGQIAKGLRVLP